MPVHHSSLFVPVCAMMQPVDVLGLLAGAVAARGVAPRAKQKILAPHRRGQLYRCSGNKSGAAPLGRGNVRVEPPIHVLKDSRAPLPLSLVAPSRITGACLHSCAASVLVSPFGALPASLAIQELALLALVEMAEA
eukprot:CAMPEP_0198244534 /NCGR_PEP_ID=MMETSP1446-20131203/35765_1 /TAXON_ID=1461542 ORGANISM="Unidentified sp, Strain CCMP2111" /NCGR_SAMPLE_ID=MMETSP1446 /ASSEMBLY_ACC=CAM_ASM_001112 /LENGTH=135 /DNA_ID=CAMNT_0043928593 /DNA_START=113 /DNA_END=518 /DNA_ORIENTATION=+